MRFLAPLLGVMAPLLGVMALGLAHPALADYKAGTRVPSGTAAGQTLRWNGTAYVFAGLMDDGVNQTSAGNFALSGILSSSGITNVGSLNNTGPATFTASAVGVVPVLIKEASGQTANPLEVDSSTNALLFRVQANGETYITSYLHSISGTLYLASASTVGFQISGTSCTAQGALTVVGTHKANLVNSVTGYQFNAAAGVTATIPLDKLTTGGTNGSLTIQGGIITAATAPN